GECDDARGLHPRGDPGAERLHRPRPDLRRARGLAHAGRLRRASHRRAGRSPRRLSHDTQVGGRQRMRYRSQWVAYPYFAVALLLYGLQVAFGLIMGAKYLGPDPIVDWLPFDRAKAIHTNLLIVWVLTGFMGAAYWLVPEESRTELHSVRLAYWNLVLWVVAGLTAVVGYLFGWTAGNKFLEQPFPVKIAIVVVMVLFLYNLIMTIRRAGRWTTTEGVLVIGLLGTAVLYLPGLIDFENYTVGIFYRWWVVHLWVEGVWEMVQAALLAYLLIRLSGVDREVMEKWLYVIVGLVFISG